MSIKLIAIDIDGTLLNENNELAPRTIKTLQAASARGVKVVLTTGRPLTGVTPYLDKLGLHGDDQYVITFNGALAQTVSGNILTKETISYDDYRDIEALSHKLAVHFHVEDDHLIYTAHQLIPKYSIGESFLVNMQIKYVPVADMEVKDYSKGMMIDEPEVIDRVIKAIPTSFHDRFYVVRSTPYFLEFINKNASKGNALNALATKLGLQQAEVMALGDQNNDLTMLEWAGLGVAMGNGTSEAKAAANVITATNAEDGVAQAVEKYVLA
ncbi:Cof subfamily protein (haloacid dehalogenase superfamily) [Weissella beninensis]|uniref:Sugar-phosphatase n=1 Tax=Periweissella beninensis TaxID=504936 RepID=A0ABT0VLG3_9LACO|nr:sugar-phosphatase [Periweissella beninensis]MBM7543968.1 Cof subfamily protein (haloacid dehalogenase superfamily) [Periweissella beninensis]MCM2437978.1 sugar-phosphatase [Periweissella beninensis]